MQAFQRSRCFPITASSFHVYTFQAAQRELFTYILMYHTWTEWGRLKSDIGNERRTAFCERSFIAYH